MRSGENSLPERESLQFVIEAESDHRETEVIAIAQRPPSTAVT
jgi:hypothetical protein